MKISTEYYMKPIPLREWDWSAIDSDTYDVDCDQDGFFSNSPVGYGATEAEAIQDLQDQIEDRETERQIAEEQCPRCKAFFAKYSCNVWRGECDCPRCQGYCQCAKPSPEQEEADRLSFERQHAWGKS